MDETNLYQTNQTENVNEGEDVSVEPGILDEIEGVGPNKKRDLLKYFGSSEQIKIAQLNEIEKVKGINKNIAKKIYNFFHEN